MPPSQICSTYVTYPIASNAIEHCSGLAGIDGLKALRERAVDFGEFIVGFRSSSARRQKPRKPCTASQEKCARMLGLRALHGAPEAAFRLRLVAGCQSEIALEQVQTGVGPVLRIALGGRAGLGESDDRVLKPLRSPVKVSKDFPNNTVNAAQPRWPAGPARQRERVQYHPRRRRPRRQPSHS